MLLMCQALWKMLFGMLCYFILTQSLDMDITIFRCITGETEVEFEAWQSDAKTHGLSTPPHGLHGKHKGSRQRELLMAKEL